MKHLVRHTACVALSAALWVSASAQMVRVTVQNLAPVSPTGLYSGPVWFGFHDGTFDFFDAGATASAATERLAELGDSSLVNAALLAAQASARTMVVNQPGGPGPGLFGPGTANSAVISLDAIQNRFLSYGAMIVPSNDTFIGNADPMAVALFGADGVFLGAQSFTLTGADVWDAGSEVNNPLDGAAFVAGVDAMLGTAEGGMIHAQTLNGLDNVIGVTTPVGLQIGQALSTDPLLRITITPVPEPSTYGVGAALTLAALAVWRRRKTWRAAH